MKNLLKMFVSDSGEDMPLFVVAIALFLMAVVIGVVGVVGIASGNPEGLLRLIAAAGLGGFGGIVLFVLRLGVIRGGG